MKKSTGIVFVVLVMLGLWTYFREWRAHPGHDQTDIDNNNNSVTMAFKVDEPSIDQIKLTRGGMTVVFDRKDDGWYETSPVMTRADQSAVGEIAHSISELPTDRTLSQVTPQQLTDYGLVNPVMTIQFRLQNGTTHTMVIGGKDFSNLEVYSQLDGSKNVTLVSNVTANAADKPFDDFRDHTVLAFPTQYEVASLDLKTPSGNISAQRDGEYWNIVKPIAAPADSGAIATLLGDVGSSKLARFISDDAKGVPPATMATYGLNDPAIRLALTMVNGKTADLLIGKKDGALEYYAMDTSRSMIFSVPGDLVAKLNSQKLDDLRSKVLYTGIDTDVTRMEVRNSAGTTTCARQANGSLVAQKTSAQSQSSSSGAQAPDCIDFLDPLQRAQATKVEDQASGNISARLAKPAITVTLTTQSSSGANPENPVSVGTPAGQPSAPAKTLKIEISAPDGNSVYARTSDGPSVYRFDKNAFDALKPASSTSAAASPVPPAANPSEK